MRLYEGMVIVDDARCSDDYDAVAEHVRGILQKNGAEIQRLDKWDDRKMAYAINHHARGVYLLIYFNAPPENMPSVNRDCQLSDVVLRALFTVPTREAIELLEAGDDDAFRNKSTGPRRYGDDYGDSRPRRRPPERSERRDDDRGGARDEAPKEAPKEAANDEKAAAPSETAEE